MYNALSNEKKEPRSDPLCTFIFLVWCFDRKNSFRVRLAIN